MEIEVRLKSKIGTLERKGTLIQVTDENFILLINSQVTHFNKTNWNCYKINKRVKVKSND
jgi:hypothetical protein